MDIVLAEEVAVAVVAVELAVAVAVGVAVAAVVSTAADAVFITGPEEAKYPVSDLKLTKLVTPHLKYSHQKHNPANRSISLHLWNYPQTTL